MSNSNFSEDSIFQIYIFETTTLLEQLDEICLDAEREGTLSAENVNEIFRIMHTIKGSSAMMNFDLVSQVTHKLEDMFSVIREKGVSESFFEDLFDLVLNVSDFIKDELEKIRNNQPVTESNDDIFEAIKNLEDHLLGGEAGGEETKESMEEPTDADSDDSDILIDDDEEIEFENLYHIRVTFAADSQMENVRALMLLNKIESIGTVVSSDPSELESNPDAAKIIAAKGLNLDFSTDLSADEVRNIISGSLSVETCNFIEKSVIEQKPDEKKQPEKEDASEQSAESKQAAQGGEPPGGKTQKPVIKQQNLISVDLTKLDMLMDLVGEIVITESMVSGSVDLEGLKLDNFNKSAHQLRKLMSELQDIVMSIRMIPISGTFRKMDRIVRDMSRKLSKDVELTIIGESTEVDKAIIDGVADPLMHVVRNAMDHGFEDKEERKKTNKAAKGHLVLSATNVGGDIIISLSDDGKGIDPEKILRKAQDRNLLTKPADEMTNKEIINLLTLPGFSMKEEVTEFSGRGVGLDVVRKGIEKIGGGINIDSVYGEGTTVVFKIPLTLAIIESMEINVGKNVYTIPISNIREAFKASSGRLIEDPGGNEMIMLRGVCYPIIRLHEMFAVEDGLKDLEEGILLLVDSGERLACLFVDELIGKRQIVVKSLPQYLDRYQVKKYGIAGCTIMGNGSISLILDVQSLLNMS